MSFIFTDSDYDPYKRQVQLDDDHYLQWSICFKRLLLVNNPEILKIISGETTAPLTDAPESEHIEFRSRQAHASLLLARFIPASDGFFNSIDIYNGDPKTVWDTIRDTYRRQLNIWNLRRQLHSVRLVDYDDALGYWFLIEGLIRKYEFAMGEGVKMAKDEVAFYYYNGLPLQDEGWEHFRVMIVMEKEYRQDPEKLQQAVRDREDLFWNKGEWGRARRRRKVTCYRCKKTGHYKNECPG